MYRSNFVNNFFDEKDYYRYLYKKNLKTDIGRAGGFLITMFVAMQISLFLVSLILDISFQNTDLPSDTSTLSMIINSLISLLSFFVAGYFYCLFRKIKLNSIIYFEKNPPSLIILLVMMGLCVAMVANYASSAVMNLFEAFGYDAYIDMSHSPKAIDDIIIYYLSYAVIPAFAEEFAFRGIVLGCIRKHSDSLAIIISSVMFGLMHGNFMQIPFAFIVGLVLGFVTVKTNSLIPAIIIHFLNNATSVTLDIISSNADLPISLINLIYTVIMITIASCGIISTITLIKKYKGLFKMPTSDGLLTFKQKVIIFCQSPTMIVFTVLTLIESILKIGT